MNEIANQVQYKCKKSTGVTDMKVRYVVNNYQLGGKVKSTPTDRIIYQNRLDRNLTEIVYELETDRQKEFCDKVLSKRGTILN